MSVLLQQRGACRNITLTAKNESILIFLFSASKAGKKRKQAIRDAQASGFDLIPCRTVLLRTSA